MLAIRPPRGRSLDVFDANDLIVPAFRLLLLGGPAGVIGWSLGSITAAILIALLAAIGLMTSVAWKLQKQEDDRQSARPNVEVEVIERWLVALIITNTGAKTARFTANAEHVSDPKEKSYTLPWDSSTDRYVELISGAKARLNIARYETGSGTPRESFMAFSRFVRDRGEPFRRARYTPGRDQEPPYVDIALTILAEPELAEPFERTYRISYSLPESGFRMQPIPDTEDSQIESAVEVSP